MTSSITVVYIVIGIAALLVGFAKGSLASALGALATPLLALVLPAPVAIGLTLPLFLIGDLCAVVIRWNTWDRRLVLQCLPGMLIGVVLGSVLLGELSSEAILHLLGTAAVLYSLYRIYSWRRVRVVTDKPLPRWYTPFFSALSSFASTVANAGGPPFTIFLMMRNETPRLFLGTTALFFAILNLTKLPAFFSVGVLHPDMLLLIAWAVPLIPFGVWTGKLMDPHISLTAFERIIVVLLILVGIYLLVK